MEIGQMTSKPTDTRRKTLRHPPEKAMSLRWKREVRAAIGEDQKGRLVGLGLFIVRLNEELEKESYMTFSGDQSTFYKALKLDGTTRHASFVEHASRILGIKEPTHDEILAEEAAGPVVARGSKVAPSPLVTSELKEAIEEAVKESVEKILREYLERDGREHYEKHDGDGRDGE